MKKLVCFIISLVIISTLFITSYSYTNEISDKDDFFISETYITLDAEVDVNVPKIVVFL